MTKEKALVWFRQDLRLSDNPALYNAALGYEIVPVYILDDYDAGLWRMGGASRWWLHYSLDALNKSLNNKLNIYNNNPEQILLELFERLDIKACFWNRCYEPWRIKRDSAIKKKLKSMNIEVQSFNGSLLWEPWDILKADKSYYQVFTPFLNAALKQEMLIRDPLPVPPKLILTKDPESLSLASLNLLPKIPWDQHMKKCWHIGEKAAHKRLHAFLKEGLLGYKQGRNNPAAEHISRLSPYLHFGEISPNYVWHEAQKIRSSALALDRDNFLSELIWREFSYYLLVHVPSLATQNFRKKFDGFLWVKNKRALKAWQQGQTGIPLVDAGMRELWQTGYMHNRVRMVVASFLTKNLFIHWHEGASWFWDCLLDADLANNSASWQWVAGSGADAAPYFRIFNPVLQGEKFDPEGLYTKKFVPELSHMPKKYLFRPWEAPDLVLKQAGVALGVNYPKPIVDLAFSRERALNAYLALNNI